MDSASTGFEQLKVALDINFFSFHLSMHLEGQLDATREGLSLLSPPLRRESGEKLHAYPLFQVCDLPLPL